MVEFSRKKIDEIKDSISRALDQGAPPIAAFDADGTLWESDMGETFFLYKVNNQLIKNLPENPWQHYEDLKEKVSHPVAYLWLAQINAGVPLEQVREWARQCLQANAPIRVIQAQQEIVKHLKSLNVDVYVVTASIKWAVEPAALEYYEIPYENVIGITTKIENGLVTKEQDGPITWRDGKVTGLLEKTNGVHPFFSSGNTSGDLFLLEAASHLRLVIASAPAGHDNRDTEQEMIALAQKKGWFAHCFWP